MITNIHGFKSALCVLGILSVLSVTGCGASENDTSFELATITDIPEEADTENKEKADEKDRIYVYVCGHVNKAGVYAVSENTRVYEVINLAQGVRDDADISMLNQAEKVADGQQIYVPSVQEMQEMQEIPGGGFPAAGSGPVSMAKDDGSVNINQADESELQKLTGIGASRAQAIIDYRNENGAFERIEDIMNVSGIKEGMFSKIKDQIKVR